MKFPVVRTLFLFLLGMALMFVILLALQLLFGF